MSTEHANQKADAVDQVSVVSESDATGQQRKEKSLP